VLDCLLPLDWARNADGVRRPVAAPPAAPPAVAAAAAPPGIAPLLRKLMADYAATGLPPAYTIPVHEEEE
jgi:putative transposase